MRSETLAREPRSTAYYYGELKHMKLKDASEVAKEPPKLDIPPFRDRPSPEYSTPEGPKRFPPLGGGEIYACPSEVSRIPRDISASLDGRIPGETYSTAGTFPISQKDREAHLEPLLAELETVGKVPLEQLGGGGRARGWYFCCPDDAEEEEMTRESSWRYSSLRPVTAPPASRSGVMASSPPPTPDEAARLRGERDRLSRALHAERRAAAAAARAHDARLAELHGVIAELMRRREGDKHRAIPEGGESQDECESTTQAAGDLSCDASRSRTDQGDTSGDVTPEGAADLPKEDTISSLDALAGLESLSASCAEAGAERGSDAGANSGRCCQLSRRSASASGRGSCERERGSREDVNTSGRYEARQAKLAYRVKLKRTEDEIREQEDLASSRAALEARCRRLEEERQDLEYAFNAANDNLHSAWGAQTALGARGEALCRALRCADRALEVYDVLLALAETAPRTQERGAAQRVAAQVLARLRAPRDPAEPLLSPGPWLSHRALPDAEPWSEATEPALRDHCARLKAQSAELRPTDMSEIEIVTATEQPGAEPAPCGRKSSSRRRRERGRHWLEAPAAETDL